MLTMLCEIEISFLSFIYHLLLEVVLERITPLYLKTNRTNSETATIFISELLKCLFCQKIPTLFEAQVYKDNK
uniref:Uncharacterized protein n=1 Tax=Kuenenia stuttgartiensis TaxID=174633 RepID=Q1PVZ2_KUEST|nr:unknown protein [Candidatus Kuenenia stuttgartiensis]